MLGYGGRILSSNRSRQGGPGWEKVRERIFANQKRNTQYFEIFGNRAIYHDGWMASTVPAVTPWEGVPSTW